MAYADMLRNRCRILRKTDTPADESDDSDWGYEPAPREPLYFPEGDWFPCWYTDKGGTEVVNVAGTDIRVTTEVDTTTEKARQIDGDDRLELDDGRIVDVLNVQILAGGFKGKVRCGSKSGIQPI